MTEKQCPRGSDQTMILVKELYKSFGPKQVLQGLNLEVKCGESMVVIGGSGTGKSVLIKCIIGLLHHDQGEIYVEGKEISNLNEKEWNETKHSICRPCRRFLLSVIYPRQTGVLCLLPVLAGPFILPHHPLKLSTQRSLDNQATRRIARKEGTVQHITSYLFC